MAKGAQARGKRIAFGDQKNIKWDVNSPTVFQGNPNIAPPGSERAPDLEWIPYYKGSRIYNQHGKGKWLWNYKFKVTPGEIYLTPEEEAHGQRAGEGFIVIEPNTQDWKHASPNRQWGAANWRALVEKLKPDFRLVQFRYKRGQHSSGDALPGVEQIDANFREALALMKHAALFVGGEGGLPHGAAATGRKAVVIFGAWVPPQITGYDTHVNITSEGAEFCGSFERCEHCIKAMASIPVELVYQHVVEQMRG